MALSTRTYKDAGAVSRTRLVGENGSAQDAGGVVLFDVNGNVLVGQQVRAASLPFTLATEDMAALASQTTLAAVLAKLIASPATEATLAAILAKLIASPATETTLAAILAKLIASPATAAKQPALGTAGTPSADVISVQGVTNGTPQQVAPALPTAGLSTRAILNIAASGDTTIVAAVGGQTVRLHKLFFITSGAVNIKFKDGASTDLTPAMPFQSGGGFVLDFDGDPWFVTTAGNPLIMNLSAAVPVSGRIYYTQS